MWNHRSWQGTIGEKSLPAGERLRHYAAWCTAVEGNTTFYATPTRETVAGWAAQTDPDFRFVLKLPKPLTHERRLADTEGLAPFLTAVEPLGPRLHALWIQLPGSFGPEDLPVLDRFLRRAPGGYRYAVEVRHPAFFTDPRAAGALTGTLAGVAAEWVPFDTTAFFDSPPTSDAEREAWTKKPRMPLRDTALTDRPIVRYLGRDDPDRTVAGWQRWVESCADWLREGRSPTLFLHTPDNAEAPALARRFHAEVRARVPELAPLPDPIPTGPLTLF
jgi:uncharacterized protein YecE (DUF72 family)